MLNPLPYTDTGPANQHLLHQEMIIDLAGVTDQAAELHNLWHDVLAPLLPQLPNQPDLGIASAHATAEATTVNDLAPYARDNCMDGLALRWSRSGGTVGLHRACIRSVNGLGFRI